MRDQYGTYLQINLTISRWGTAICLTELLNSEGLTANAKVATASSDTVESQVIF
jgi:hypothetical protein